MKNTLQRIIGLLFCFYCLHNSNQASAQKASQPLVLRCSCRPGFQFGYSVVVNNGQTQNNTSNIEKGRAAISHSAGQLLFYTDGETVYNRFHNVMPNGTAIGGGQSSSQLWLFFRNAGDPSKYYVFTTDDLNQLQNGLNYSIVDMCLDGGNGDVMPAFKNIHLLDTASEACRLQTQ